MKNPEALQEGGGIGNEVIPHQPESPLHPDLQAGIDAIMRTSIAHAVKRGFGASFGLNNAAKSFAEILAAGQVSLSEAGEAHYSGLAYGEVAEGINTGLQNAINDIIRHTQSGIQNSSSLREIPGLFELAEKMGIAVAFIPEKDGAAEDKAPLAPLRTKEEVLAYCRDLIDKNLLRGIQGKLDMLKYEVGRGRFSEEAFDVEIEKWLGQMQEHGYEIVDEGTSEESPEHHGTDQILRRQINRVDIMKLKEGIIRDNLAVGLEKLLSTTEYNMRSGARHPLEGYMEAKDKYIAEATKRGLIDIASPAIRDGASFNPDLLPEEIERIIKKNIQSGIEEIVKRLLHSIQAGEIGMIPWYTEIAEEYFQIAKERNVFVENEAAVREYMESCVSAENLQAGVYLQLKKVREYLRQGDISLSRFLLEKIDLIRKVAHERGLSDEVDFSQVDKYLEDVKLGPPALGEAKKK